MRLHEVNFGPTTAANEEPRQLAAFVEAITREGLEQWGFVVVRTTFGDDTHWAEFRQRWDEALQDQMVEEVGAGIDEVRDRLQFLWVEDHALDGARPDAVRR